ncbi:ABC transporter permease (plasmid) [Agrobacterium leguminum]|uniref:Spermidine/putrescine transport system permease protein PotB n=1 Tax=Agrobacterium deltaense NCPPB 1641 TaxID=1183425 RepID=A0A1S7U9P8_9HYPH|nr:MULTISPECIES: ABC transporter permease [Agrobacterium]WFS69623.1 ABC transporter permease [Agrobacterium leguminum]CVI63603.1 putative Spermidine/putrescine transport system permease protein PotB [Agrobacterium deltaense NCPPB 1641]
MSQVELASQPVVATPAGRAGQNRVRLLLIGPPLIYYIFLLAIPFASVVALGFATRSDTGLFDLIFTWSNYAVVLTDPFYWKIGWTTLRLSIVTTLICLVLAYPVAYRLAGLSMRARKIFLILLMFPLLLSTIIRVYGWMVILGRRGLLNQSLIELGLLSRPVSFLQTEWTVIVGLVSILIPYAVINIMNALATIDPMYKEAAAIHSASPFKVFVHVTFPLSRPGIVSGGLIIFSLTMGTYLVSLLLGGPGVKMFGNVVFDSINGFNWPLGAAVSAVLVLITLVTTSAFSRLLATPNMVR